MIDWHTYNSMMRDSDVSYSEKNRQTRQQMYKRYIKDMDSSEELVELAPLPKVVPQSGWWPSKIQGKKADWVITDDICDCKQEGKTPMRNYNDSYACASVQTPKSDAAVTRDYLLSRLEKAGYTKDNFVDMFNLNVNNTPKNFKELIDVFKAGKYTIDPKIEKKLAFVETADDDEDNHWYHGPLYGIIWDGPKADWDGYNKAREDMQTEQTKARDVIMTGDAAAGLAAIQAFEAWTPTVATTTVQ